MKNLLYFTLIMALSWPVFFASAQQIPTPSDLDTISITLIKAQFEFDRLNNVYQHQLSEYYKNKKSRNDEYFVNIFDQKYLIKNRYYPHYFDSLFKIFHSVYILGYHYHLIYSLAQESDGTIYMLRGFSSSQFTKLIHNTIGNINSKELAEKVAGLFISVMYSNPLDETTVADTIVLSKYMKKYSFLKTPLAIPIEAGYEVAVFQVQSFSSERVILLHITIFNDGRIIVHEEKTEVIVDGKSD